MCTTLSVHTCAEQPVPFPLSLVGENQVNTHEIVRQIDEEVAKLQQARALLTDEAAKRGPGRPAKTAVVPQKQKTTRKAMSAEARAKIAAAQKARWAKSKKTAKG